MSNPVPAAVEKLARGYVDGELFGSVDDVLLGAIYYLLLTPIGLLMRLFRYDPMYRRFDRTAQTYWVERDTQRPKASYFKQY